LGANLIVGVHQTQAAPAHVAGLAIEPFTDGGSYDVLRVERGKVVDRWTSGFDWLDATPFEEAALFTSGSIGMTPVLKRIVIPDGAQLSWKSGAQAMLFVETGTARMTTIVSGQEAATVTLDAGMAMAIPAAASHRLRAAGRDDVHVLLYSAPANPPGNYFAPAGSSTNTNAPAVDVFDEEDAGVTQTVLWQGNLAEVGWDRVHAGVRLVLPAGEAIDLIPPPRTLVLVSIDRGSIEIFAPGDTVSNLGADSTLEESDGIASIDAAHGAFIDAEGAISLQNTTMQPVVVLLIAMEGTPMGVERESP
jgi:mannose-6-phosphate isomerase-like protein (cupin superfamily)